MSLVIFFSPASQWVMLVSLQWMFSSTPSGWRGWATYTTLDYCHWLETMHLITHLKQATSTQLLKVHSRSMSVRETIQNICTHVRRGRMFQLVT